jgi:hypothetical protein
MMVVFITQWSRLPASLSSSLLHNTPGTQVSLILKQVW